MIFTPEDTVHYDVLTQDVKINVLPKFVDMTGTPGCTLIPFDGADPLYGKTATLEITLDGLLNGDMVTLSVSEGYGLSLSGNTKIGNNTSRTINANYDGTTTIIGSGPVILELYISNNINYILDGSGFELTILDGRAESRAISVTQANMAAFTSYANTEGGLARYYKLEQNIAVAERTSSVPVSRAGFVGYQDSGDWEPVGTNDAPFIGNFDGNGFIISNIAINGTSAYQGIFGYIGADGVVKNVGVVDGSISGGNYTGGIAGYNNGTIQNCYVSGNVSGGSYSGGIAGFNNGTVENCYSTSSVSGNSYIGGVAGQNSGMVQNCYATGRIGGTNYIGGVAGMNNGGIILNCIALNSMITKSSGGSTNIGRMVGSVSGGTMSNNYARHDMVVKYSWDGNSGTGKAITDNGIDGSSVSPAQYNTQSWWMAEGNWNSGGIWNFAGLWVMNTNSLPRLRTAGGSQNHELPTGDGTEANPFRVYNVATLRKVGSGTDGWGLYGHYLQIQDIALLWQAVSQSNWTPIGKFGGVYDGNGHQVLNLTTYTIASDQGMFSYIETDGVVKNLGLVGGSVMGSSSVGGLAGNNYGKVQNRYTPGSVGYFKNNSMPYSYYIGGLVGANYGTVQSCYTTGGISGDNSTGGIVGYNDIRGTVQNCYTTSNVSGNSVIGGVVGANAGTVRNCYATGSVSGSDSVGGVVGDNEGTIQNCSALNSMVTTSSSASTRIGRVVGYTYGSISNNYARGDMTIKYNWRGVNTGTDKTVNENLETVDGKDIDSWEYKDGNWWRNAINWNFTDTWEMNANDLPKLKNSGGVQDHFILTGEGTETNPFPVYDVDTLKKVGSGTDKWDLNKHYKQVRDIALPLPADGQSNWTTNFTNTRQFTGSFNGNGFTISNITINETTAYQGIFGYIGTGGAVKNVALVNGNVSGGAYTGGIAGYSNGTIQNCYMAGSVSGGTYIGGIAGYNNGTVQNSYSASLVSGSSNVGGVAGQNNGTVQNCYAAGRVNGSSGYIGGIVGSGGTVQNCVALNPGVITKGNNSDTIGRVLGSGSGSNNYARNDMVVRYNWNDFSGIAKSFSRGLTTADGANVGSSDYNTLSWWQSTVKWDTANIWTMNVNKLPKLKNVGGAQNHTPGLSIDFMEMVEIKSGSFMMGSPANEENRFGDEGPQHTVYLTIGFYMGKYAVTQEQYQAVMGTNPSGFKTAAVGENAARLPVEQVTWYDAVEFCNKLSQREGLTPAYTISGRTPASGYPITSATVTLNSGANGSRLPTEAQWEYACRAGTTTAYHADNTTDNPIDIYAWYNANSEGRTREVGILYFLANNWGLYDMHGNVWEWCWDWFGSYSSGNQNDPVGASSGVTRVNRGGSWYSSLQGIRSACRNGDLPSAQFANLGFRVVRPVL
jgi:formylglycine-generating enzyme required for sulfatase activity